MIWIGGMIFFVFVFVMSIRQPEFAAIKPLLLEKVSYKFRRLSWFVFLLLGITGYYQSVLRGFGLSDLILGWHNEGLAWLLSVKFILFISLLVASFIHDFIVGPRALFIAKMNPHSVVVKRLNTQARFLGLYSLLMSLIVVYFGIVIVRGT